ncbi:MAG: 30S ribosomal protein S18 [Anaerolineales bacterium]|nr:30S ribosomal protein S18 [Anaerolineales bacterium]
MSQASPRPPQRQTGARPQQRQTGGRPQQRRRGGGRRYTRRPRICQFCADKTIIIEYKKIDVLRRYVSEGGKIRPRRETGACARHQRKVARAIKRARHMALLPFAAERYR